MANETEANPVVLPPAPAKAKKSSAPVGVILGTFFVAIIFVSNLDTLGKHWYSEGSLIPSIYCYEVFTGAESVLGAKTERVASAYAELSHAYSKVPRYRDAIRAEEQAIALRSELTSPTDPNVIILKAHVGEYMAQQKQYAAADKYLAGVLKEAQTAPEPISLAYVYEAQAKSYLLQKRYAEALAAAAKMLPIDDDLMSRGRNPFDGRELMAEIAAKSGDLDGALENAEDSLMQKELHLRDNNVTLALAHECLGRVFVLKKDTDSAKEQFRQAQMLLEKEYGAGGERMQYWRARYKQLVNEPDPFEK